MTQEHAKQVARILADEAGFEICELFGKPEVCIPSDSADYGILDHLTRFYELVREQTIKEINGTDDPLMRQMRPDSEYYDDE